MNDERKTKTELVKEIRRLWTRMRNLENSGKKRRVREKAPRKAVLSSATDITERKRAEEQLKETVEWQKAIFEGSRDAVFISDSESRFVSVNKAACDLTGFTRQELLTMSIPDLHEEPDLKVYNDSHERIMQGEEILSEAKIRRKDGSKVDTEFNNTRIVISGTPYMHTTARNIAGRKQVQEKLRESEDRYRDLVEHSQDLICTHDLEGRIVSANSWAAKSLGYTIDTILQMNIRDFLVPEVRGGFDTYLAKIQKRGAVNGRLLVQTAAGERRIWEYNNTLRAEGVARPIVRGMARDVTERKRMEDRLVLSERKYREMFDLAPVGIYQSTFEGRFISVNNALTKILGYDFRDEMMQLDMANDVYFDKQQRAALVAQFEPEGSVADHEILWKKKNGDPVWVQLDARAVKDITGKTLQFEGFVRNITERKQAKRALWDSERRFRSQFDGFPLPTYTWQVQGEQIVLVGYNAAADHFTKHHVQKLMGKTVLELYPDRPDIVDDFKRCLDTREPIHREMSYHFQYSGQERELSADYVFVPPDLVMVHIEDITAHRRAEEERIRSAKLLRESHDRLELALRGADLGMWDWTISTNRNIYNKRWAEMLGYSLEELEPSYSTWEALVHPEDRARVVGALKAHVEGKTPSYETEHRLRTKSGEWRWILDRGKVLEWDDQGKPVRAVGTHMDITERKRAEQELQKLSRAAEQTADGLLITDKNGIIEYVNHAFEKLTGYSKEEVIGKTPRILRSGTYDSTFYQNMWRIVESGDTFHSVLVNRKKNGELYSEEKTIVPIRDHNGVITHFLSVGTDITERERAEEIARTYFERLQVLSKHLLEIQENERRTLARELHDEIGQALTSLKIHLEMSTMTNVDTAKKHIKEGIEIASDLVTRLRGISLDLRPPMLDDLGLVPAMRWHLLEHTRKAGITGRFIAEPEEIWVSREIATACFRVAQEALTNVLRHSKAKSVKVELMKRGSNLELQIRDDGNGFDVDSVLRRTEKGQGFGLLGMQERVRLAGGDLEIFSEQGNGSKIRATFPDEIAASSTDSGRLVK